MSLEMILEYECSVCCEDILEKNMCECPFCDYVCCKSCVKTYLLGTTQLAHCMNCKQEWSISFLQSVFGSWVTNTKKGGYRHHQKEVLIEKERAKLPQTIAKIPGIRAMNKARADLTKLVDERTLLNRRLAELKDSIRIQEAVVAELSRDNETPLYTTSNNGKYLSRYICPCPYDDCKGLINSEKYECDVCLGRVCRKCREKIDDSEYTDSLPKNKRPKHRCSKDALDSIKDILSNTKPCPKCAVPIHKISGCNSMFCTVCHLSFNWRTGKEEVGVHHNPHAIEYYREHHRTLDRDPNDVVCGGLIDIFHIERQVPEVCIRNQFNRIDTKEIVYRMHRFIAEIRNSIDTLNYEINNQTKLDELRLKYVTKKITEDKWKQSIFRLERETRRKEVKRDVYNTLETLAIERFRALYDKTITLSRFKKEMEDIRVFINKTLQKELKILGCTKPPQIVEKWIWKAVQDEQISYEKEMEEKIGRTEEERKKEVTRLRRIREEEENQRMIKLEERRQAQERRIQEKKNKYVQQ